MAKRLNDKKKKLIVADYAELGSYAATARRHKVSVDTVRRVVLGDPVIMLPSDLEQLTQWIAKGEAHKFYWTYKWKIERAFVLKQDSNECQHCKANGRYRRASLVHHIKHLTKHPQYALNMWIEQEGVMVRQLISLCDECHELEHPERLRQYRKKKGYTNVERWD